MQVVYGYVYYFIVVFIALTAMLAVFILPAARRLLHKIQTKYQSILNNTIFRYLTNFSFAIIALILIDSIKTFMSLNYHFKEHEHTVAKIGLERMDIVKTQVGQSMLGVLKEYREYYLAQRNIMLTLSALFIYYVFQRLLFNIRKLADEEHRRAHPLEKSVILEVIAQLAQLKPQSQKQQAKKQSSQRAKQD